MRQSPFVINATGVGATLSGIGRYGVELCRYLLEHWAVRFDLIVNDRAIGHFRDVPTSGRIRTAPGFVSPDGGIAGTVGRVLHANAVALRYRDRVLFALSPLEACVAHPRQVVTVHDLMPLALPEIHRGAAKGYYRRLVPMILHRAARVIAVSDDTRRSVVEAYGVPAERVTVIPNAVGDRFRGHPTRLDKDPYLLFVGRLARSKNLGRLFEAFALLRHRYGLDVTLKCAGSSPGKCRPEGTPAGVEILGYVSDGALVELYRRALACVIPSLSEGFGLPAVEAMACGCPVVAARVASLGEICGDAAVYADANDVENLAHGMHIVATEAPLRQRLIERGRQRAERFTVEATARAHMHVFEDVLRLAAPEGPGRWSRSPQVE